MLETAAALLFKGMTAEYLLHRTHTVRAGETILVHAAAGGVGTFLCQWGKHLGARVIGTVGSDEKARIARDNGCDVPIVSADYRFADAVRAATHGRGVDVVFDGLGRLAERENYEFARQHRPLDQLWARHRRAAAARSRPAIGQVAARIAAGPVPLYRRPRPAARHGGQRVRHAGTRRAQGDFARTVSPCRPPPPPSTPSNPARPPAPSSSSPRCQVGGARVALDTNRRRLHLAGQGLRREVEVAAPTPKT